MKRPPPSRAHKTALVIVLSLAHNDPRVRRQVTWLANDGWTVDTIGIGPTPSDEVRDHFPLANQKPWVMTKLGVLVTYLLFTTRTMFRRLAVDRIDPAVLSRIAEGEYTLVVFNDMDFLPLAKDPRVFTEKALTAHLHADIHEYREPRMNLSPWRLITRRYYTWQRKMIGDPIFDTRSTVASRIADFYVEDFGIELPALVRNIPPFHDQRPSAVDPRNIRMLFHGLASWARGFDEILEAMHALDERFTMTFMLTGSESVIEELRERAVAFGDRVRVIPPVPMMELSATVNQYDIEIMFYPPVQRNVEFALPNKFFEAVQGRLALVVGESPMMAELVQRHQLGLIVEGWTGTALARAINSLTVEQIESFKANADRAATELSAEHEGKVFLETIATGRRERA